MYFSILIIKELVLSHFHQKHHILIEKNLSLWSFIEFHINGCDQNLLPMIFREGFNLITKDTFLNNLKTSFCK